MDDDDDWVEVDPDYGVFGDPGGLVRRSSLPPSPPDWRALAEGRRQREREDARRRVSSDFNLHMILLFNERQKR